MCASILWLGHSLFYFGYSVLQKRYTRRTQMVQTQYLYGFPTVQSLGIMSSLGH